MQNNDDKQQARLDIGEIREKLAGKGGQDYWRTLDEVADTPQFQRFLDDEFPNRSTLLQMNRRDLLKFMGASVALAGLSGCRSVFMPEDKVVPYVKQPEELVPGKPLFYASALTLAGYATGVLVEQHEGRPIKIEGNPEHPSSLGALDAITQAQLLSLYDPDRVTSPMVDGSLSSWVDFSRAMTKALDAQKASGGAGIRILTGAITSPTFTDLITKFTARYPNATWHSWEPVGRTNAKEGATLAYGSPLNTIYRFRTAKVVVSLDGDFLSPTENPGSLVYARDFAAARRVVGTKGEMNRLYAFESTPGLVGIMADHRFVTRASEIEAVAQSLLEAVQSGSSSKPNIAAVAKDLLANRGASVVVTGDHQPAAVHALVHAINQALGNVGKTVVHTAAVETTVGQKVRGINSLTTALKAGQVDVLINFGVNAVYTAPADLGFADAIKKAKTSVYIGFNEDETSKLSNWHMPASHELESWGDARAHDGTVSIIQPIIAPIFDTRSSIEILATLLGESGNGYDLTRNTWKKRGLGGDFEKEWRRAVHDGLIKGSALPLQNPVLNLQPLPTKKPVTGVEVMFRVDPTIYDGRFANNGWLQELPKPISKTTWDNVVMVAPKFAQKLGVIDDDVVKLELNGREVNGCIFIQPGHPDEAVTIHLGYGRTAGGVVATVTDRDGGGFNAYTLRTSDAMSFAGGLTVTPIGGQNDIATTQGHSPLNSQKVLDKRDIIREGTLAAFLKDPKSLRENGEEESEFFAKQNLYPEQIFEETSPQWGMTIDLNTCIGCNACVTACQAENNISVVGKVQVMRHREMHWIRIDRYYKGDDENPQATWQPVACVHCEKAPCEPVCPVAATVHSHEGLNQMVYNRCVGTRYCSNNCPYKVRKFNYLNYSDNQPNFSEKTFENKLITGPIHAPKQHGVELLRMLNNPDVTVRGRGIMEKCTYCVQRINDARIESKKAGRPIKEGDIVTACQQACPTQTIVFGNIADESSEVAKLRKDPRSYLLLEELQTRPRTSHLAKLRNPNPELVKQTS